MTTNYRLILEEILPNGQKRAVTHTFAINEKFVENHLSVMSRDALPSMANELASTKGFIEEDRFTPQWNVIADQLKDIARVHPEDSRVLVLPVVEIDKLIADIAAAGEDGDCRDAETHSQISGLVHQFFYGDGDDKAPL